MKPKIVVFGAGDAGHTIAADLTLAGYSVNLLELSKFEEKIAGAEKSGGIHLSGNVHALVSGKTGFAKPNMITTNVEKALKDAAVIFLDCPVTEYENRIETIAPYLEKGQIINFQTYGYWPSLRVADILRKSGKEVVLSESPAPIYWTEGKDGHAKSTWIRGGVPVGIFPARKTEKAFSVLKSIFPSFVMAKNVLQTNFENINLLVHPAIALLNIGALDRAEEKKEKFNFYITGNTLHASILAEAYDQEREAMCKKYQVPHTSLREHIINFYDSKGETVQEAIQNAKPYQDPGWSIDLGYLINYMAPGDIPLVMIPFVLLADLAGVSTPLTRAFIEILGATFKIDFWKKGLTLKKLGLEDMNVEKVIAYVTQGNTK